MTDPQTQLRQAAVFRADAALAAYSPNQSIVDPQATLRDLLADLMYLADEKGWDFEENLRLARRYFEEGE